MKRKFAVVNGVRFEVTPEGLLCHPRVREGGKKHPCPDCHFCQGCSQTRCSLCLRQRVKKEIRSSVRFRKTR